MLSKVDNELVYRLAVGLLLEAGGTTLVHKETIERVVGMQHLGTRSGYTIEARRTVDGNVVYTVRQPNASQLNLEV